MNAKFDPARDYKDIKFGSKRGRNRSNKGSLIEAETYTVMKKNKT
jgi:hypothetical protein